MIHIKDNSTFFGQAGSGTFACHTFTELTSPCEPSNNGQRVSFDHGIARPLYSCVDREVWNL